jgi:hypothetical protein
VTGNIVLPTNLPIVEELDQKRRKVIKAVPSTARFSVQERMAAELLQSVMRCVTILALPFSSLPISLRRLPPLGAPRDRRLQFKSKHHHCSGVRVGESCQSPLPPTMPRCLTCLFTSLLHGA